MDGGDSNKTIVEQLREDLKEISKLIMHPDTKPNTKAKLLDMRLSRMERLREEEGADRRVDDKDRHIQRLEKQIKTLKMDLEVYRRRYGDLS